MTAKRIEITYIDDKIDLILSNYLKAYVEGSNMRVPLKYNEIVFDQDHDYNYLMNNAILKKSDILIIDSRLYENDKTRGNNYTGEVFELLLRDRSPYVEVIAVTKNNVSENSATLKKADQHTHEEYYNNNLKPLLDYFVKRTAEYRNKIKKISKKELFDKTMLNRIKDFLNHDDTYNLTSKDIDEIIRRFNSILKG